MDNITLQKLYSIIGRLESKVDQLEAELGYLNQMLIQCGFPNGIQTLKESMSEYLIVKEDPTIISRRKEDFE